MNVIDNKDSSNKNEELVTREEIKDTPFHIIGTEEGFFGVVGKYRITEPNYNKKEIEKELKKITWNRIVQIMLILIETEGEVKKAISKNKKI